MNKINMNRLIFRPLTATDFPQMLQWLLQPHVKQWWDDGEETLEQVAAHYGDREDGVVRFILWQIGNQHERPIGYFQSYPLADGSVGIDQFIGGPDCINRGLGTIAIAQFVALIRQRYGPVPIVLDPEPDNARAIRCYEKVGFRHDKTCAGHKPHTLAYMMRLEPLG